MQEWYIWVIMILGALVILGGGAYYVLWATRQDTKGKILVNMRTLTGEDDEFLAFVQEGFVIMPEKKRKYLEKFASEFNIPKKEATVSDMYMYDLNATVRSHWPSKKGWLSILSAPIDKIMFNEGDPIPLPRTKLDKDGNIIRPRPIDSATAIAYAQDRKIAGTLQMVGDEMERERRKMGVLASKFVPAFVHYIVIVVLIAAIGATVWGYMYISSEIDYIKQLIEG